MRHTRREEACPHQRYIPVSGAEHFQHHLHLLWCGAAPQIILILTCQLQHTCIYVGPGSQTQVFSLNARRIKSANKIERPPLCNAQSRKKTPKCGSWNCLMMYSMLVKCINTEWGTWMNTKLLSFLKFLMCKKSSVNVSSKRLRAVVFYLTWKIFVEYNSRRYFLFAVLQWPLFWCFHIPVVYTLLCMLHNQHVHYPPIFMPMLYTVSCVHILVHCELPFLPCVYFALAFVYCV